jgi:hypothetical protein
MHSASSNGQPFSILVAGRKHYVFYSLADIATIHKTKAFDIKNFVKILMSNLFGLSEEEAIHHGSIKPAIHELNTTYLLTAKNNATEASRYFASLDEVFNALDKELQESKTNSAVKDGFAFVTNTQGTATIQSYFGQTLLDINPDILSDVTIFSGEGFWPLLSGTPAPRIFYPKLVAARERVARDVRDWIRMVEKDETLTSPYLAARIKVLKEQGVGENATTRDLVAMLFG